MSLSKIIPILSLQIRNKNEVNLTIKNKMLVKTICILKNHVNFQYKILTSISCVDYYKNKKRFKIVYDLLSIRFNSRIRIKIFSDEFNSVDSCVSIFKASDWYESEIWDLYGVFFCNRYNLTRLLTDYGFDGYPMRKDFPLTGFVETSFDFKKRQLLNHKIELNQEFRGFEFQSPWENISLGLEHPESVL